LQIARTSKEDSFLSHDQHLNPPIPKHLRIVGNADLILDLELSFLYEGLLWRRKVTSFIDYAPSFTVEEILESTAICAALSSISNSA
jgi:hypothetical protein